MTFSEIYTRSIARKLMLYLAMGSGLFALVLFLIQIKNYYNEYYNDLNEKLSHIEKLAKNDLVHNVWSLDLPLLHANLEGITNLPDVSYVELKLDNGEVLTAGGANAKNLNDRIERHIPLEYVHNGKQLDLGELKIVVSLDGLKQKIYNKFWDNLSWQLLYIVVVCVAFLLIYYYLVGRNLKAITDHTKKISVKEFNPIQLRRKKNQHLDELDQLVDALNAMGEAVKLSYQQLEQSHNILKQKNEELDQFASVVSHDLKTPLNGIIGFSYLLNERLQHLSPAEIKMYVSEVHKSSMHLKELIDDLLEFCRSDKFTENFKAVDCEDIYHNCVNTMVRSKNSKELQITHDKLPVVLGDKLLIERLFQNLMENAIKYNESSVVKIHLSCQDSGDQYIISVKDNGIGMDEAGQAKIFQMFKRLHARDKYEGTGIGLATCKKIVEAHGGKIWVESSIGNGSTFYFSLNKNMDIQLNSNEFTTLPLAPSLETASSLH